jgi:hypothetical protein
LISSLWMLCSQATTLHILINFYLSFLWNLIFYNIYLNQNLVVKLFFVSLSNCIRTFLINTYVCYLRKDARLVKLNIYHKTNYCIINVKFEKIRKFWAWKVLVQTRTWWFLSKEVNVLSTFEVLKYFSSQFLLWLHYVSIRLMRHIYRE